MNDWIDLSLLSSLRTSGVEKCLNSNLDLIVTAKFLSPAILTTISPQWDAVVWVIEPACSTRARELFTTVSSHFRSCLALLLHGLFIASMEVIYAFDQGYSVLRTLIRVMYKKPSLVRWWRQHCSVSRSRWFYPIAWRGILLFEIPFSFVVTRLQVPACLLGQSSRFCDQFWGHPSSNPRCF